MSWRKHQSHRAETIAVKKALAKAGIQATVGHGTGTAWAWLEIWLPPDTLKHQKVKDGYVVEMTLEEAARQPYYLPCIAGCKACEEARELRRKVLDIAMKVTGRHGEYDGKIDIISQ